VSAPAATSRAPTGTSSAGATRAGRVGTPEDITGLCIFLSSRAGAYTVGEVITSDGGQVVAGRGIPQA
jgi:NAD(P)-dependent dehydrogenase (short-subunit alcohol dehydrogenase family)